MLSKTAFLIISLFFYSNIITAQSNNETECRAKLNFDLNSRMDTMTLMCANKVKDAILTKQTMTGAQVTGQNYTVANSPHPILAFGLSIDGNVTIEENAMSAFPNISRMVLDCIGKRCKLHSSDGEFKHIKRLEGISCKGVQFTHNVIELIRSSKSLQWLTVHCWGLRSIKARMLGDLPMLSVLWLGLNDIEEVEKDAFDGLSSLQMVSLTHNKLSQLPDGLFDKAKGLNHVVLSGNKFRNLNRSFCQGMKNVSSLSINSNELTYLEPEALRELVNLTNIEMEYNHFAQLAPGQFNGTKLEAVSLKGNWLKKIESTCFQGATKMRILDLSYNNITTIEAGAFDHLTRIDIGNNQLAQLAPGQFNGTKLERVDLSGNRLKKIQRTSFQGAMRMRILDLSKNNITTIEAGAFDHLTLIVMGNNQLAQLAPGQFNGTKLEVVDLSRNWLKNIERTSFQGAMRMRRLDLSYNNITTIEAGAFDDLTNLKEVDLGCTKIKSLPDGLFNNTKALEWIKLPQWFKRIISRDNFSHCPNLTDITFDLQV